MVQRFARPSSPVPMRRPAAIVLLTLVAVVLGACALAGGGEADEAEEPELSLRYDGPDDALVNADGIADLRFTVRADPADRIQDLDFRLNGERPADAHVDRDASAGTLTFAPDRGLDDGEHHLEVVVLAGDPADSDEADAEADVEADAEAEVEVVHAWRFTVDTVPPELTISSPDGPAAYLNRGLTVAGTTEPDAELHLDDRPADVADDGSFEVEVELTGTGVLELTIVAVDLAGNRTEEALELRVLPSRVERDEIRGVHVTAHAWATPSFRERILGMAERGQINTIQLDLKDEAGLVGYASEVELAQETGAAHNIYNLADAIAELHARDLHVVGRIVAFRDKYLADWAWENGHRDWVIQTPDGERYTGYGGFTNFAHPEVIEYNLALAEEAAAAGIDGILWDYIRRPDGPAENLLVVGLSDNADGPTMEEAIVDFTAKARARLAPYDVDHGVSVYGIAATRPTQIAQDIAGMAQHVDYVAPMLYPSHWGPGEYNVADPNRQPYDIIYRSLEAFLDRVDGTGARIVPWLEDTFYRAWDRAEQVREQHRAALDRGIDEWLMWDPHVRYTLEAYPERDEKFPAPTND